MMLDWYLIFNYWS